MNPSRWSFVARKSRRSFFLVVIAATRPPAPSSRGPRPPPRAPPPPRPPRREFQGSQAPPEQPESLRALGLVDPFRHLPGVDPDPHHVAGDGKGFRRGGGRAGGTGA